MQTFTYFVQTVTVFLHLQARPPLAVTRRNRDEIF